MLRKTKHRTIFSLIFCFTVNISFSQNTDDQIEIFSKIDSVIANGVKEEAFPGAVLLLASKDSILYHKAYGYHTYDSLTSVQKYHLYDLASVTKVTAGAMALMKLYDDQLLYLDDPIKRYVKGFAMNKRGKATLRETLAHQGGWRPWIPYYQKMINSDGSYKRRFFSENRSNKYPIQIKSDLHLTKRNYKYIKRKIKKSDFNPDAGYSYSGLFSYLIPELVKNTTEMTFEQYLKVNFYDTLGAETLGFNPKERFADSLIVPTEIDTFFRQENIHGTVHDEGAILMGGISGNAGLFSNALDLYKVWNLLLNKGTLDSVEYIKRQTIELFTTYQYPNQENRRGLGFDKPLLVYDADKSAVSKYASSLSYGHSGYTGPLVWADPENDLILIFLTNRVYPNRLQRNIYELNIRPLIHDLSYQLRTTYH